MLLDRYDLFRWFDRHLRDSVPGQVAILGPPDTEGGLDPSSDGFQSRPCSGKVTGKENILTVQS
jgi:hypothetical protein